MANRTPDGDDLVVLDEWTVRLLVTRGIGTAEATPLRWMVDARLREWAAELTLPDSESVVRVDVEQ